jgi:hypothetical protein
MMDRRGWRRRDGGHINDRGICVSSHLCSARPIFGHFRMEAALLVVENYLGVRDRVFLRATHRTLREAISDPLNHAEKLWCELLFRYEVEDDEPEVVCRRVVDSYLQRYPGVIDNPRGIVYQYSERGLFEHGYDTEARVGPAKAALRGKRTHAQMVDALQQSEVACRAADVQEAEATVSLARRKAVRFN